MRLLLALPVLLFGSVLAAPFKLTPARTASLDVRKVNDPELAKWANYRQVAAAWPYLQMYAVKGVPNDAWFQDHCQTAVLENLKSPGSAEFVKVNSTFYNTVAGVYANTGEVDSQNTYGALVRSGYVCTSVFEGTAKGGVVYFQVDINTRK